MFILIFFLVVSLSQFINNTLIGLTSDSEDAYNFNKRDSIIIGLIFVVGILITIYAITEIVGFVFGRKNQTEVNVNEAVIVNEQITTKEDEVKLLGNGE